MNGAPARMSRARYWAAVAAFVVALLTVQSVMGLGIDKFKELWGTEVLEVVAYAIVLAGAALVAAVGCKVWSRCSGGQRTWMVLALLLYGAGTLSARSPQERLHYLGYGILAALLYFGLARDRDGALPTPAAAAGPEAPPEAAPGSGNRSAVVPALGALLLGSAIGYADELLQILWPRRYFDWADVAMNVVAVALGLLVAIPVYDALCRR